MKLFATFAFNPMKPLSFKRFLILNKVHLRKYVFLLALYFFILPLVYAQNIQTASATVSVIITTDIIGANEFKSMDFRNIKGTLEDQILKSTSQNNSAASFNIIANSLYFITVPANDILLIKTGCADIMKVGSFNIISTKADPDANMQVVYIGATLNVNALQPPGRYYTNSSVPVTINYN